MGSVSSLHFLYFGRVYVEWIGIISSLRIWCTSPVKSSGPEVFSVGRFLTINQKFLVDIGIFRISISSWWGLVVCVFQRIYPFHLHCQMYFHNIVSNIHLFFNIFRACSNVPSFILNHGNLCLLFFFPWYLW